ncbi:hypothetical protein D3C75_667800 [compost metagenome]
MSCCLNSLLTGVVDELLLNKLANEKHGIRSIAITSAILRILLYSLIKLISNARTAK